MKNFLRVFLIICLAALCLADISSCSLLEGGDGGTSTTARSTTTASATTTSPVSMTEPIPNGLTFEAVGDEGYAVDRYTGSATELVIPSTYRGKPVVAIDALAFWYCEELVRVTIPDGVTRIGDSAFCGCESIESITIPDSVTHIGDRAFYECEALESITIPNGVKRIEDYVFYECESLESITIPDSVKHIGDYAFYGCDSLKTVSVGSGVITIGSSAFYNCTNLKAVYISDLAAWCEINFNGFYENSSNPLRYGAKLYLDNALVTSLVIPDSVTTIAPAAFYGCASLTSLTIPSSVTCIGEYAFYRCANLTSVTFETIDGWQASDWTAISVSPADLAYEAIAAKTLKSTDVSHTWTRE